MSEPFVKIILNPSLFRYGGMGGYGGGYGGYSGGGYGMNPGMDGNFSRIAEGIFWLFVN